MWPRAATGGRRNCGPIDIVTERRLIEDKGHYLGAQGPSSSMSARSF